MNKRTRIGLVVLLTVSLLLALTVPGMATEGNETFFCSPRVLTVDQQGNYHDRLRIDGELTAAYWEDGTLLNICEGEIPFGEPIDPGGLRYATFEETCDYFEGVSECEHNRLLVTSDDVVMLVRMRDPESGLIYLGTYWAYELHKNGGWSTYKEYTP